MNSWWQDAEMTLTNQSAKPIMVFIFDPTHKFAKALVNNLMCSSTMGNFVNKNFLCFGMLNDSKEKTQIDRIVPNAEIPCIVILRKDKLENVEVLNENLFTFGQESSILDNKVTPVLEGAIEQYKTAKNADKTFINDFERKKQERQQWRARQQQMNFGSMFNDPYDMGMNYQNPQQFNPQPAPQQGFNADSNTNMNSNTNPDAMSEQDLQRMQDRMMKEEQDKVYQDMINQQIQEEQSKHQELERIRKEMSNEKHAVEAKESKKENILKNLGVEPENGSEGCFTSVIRLPSGARLTRNFLKSDKLQMMNDYVFVQEDKGFEDNNSQFELMTGYPPKPITNYEQTFEEFSKKPKELFVLKEKTD